MEAYWPMIPPNPPPTGNIKINGTRMNCKYKQKEQWHDELNKQRFFRQVTHEIHSCSMQTMQMTLEIQIKCKQLQQYVEDKQLAYKKKQLEYKKEQNKYEEHCNKEHLKYKKCRKT